MVLFHMFPSTVLCGVRFAADVTFEFPLISMRRHIMPQHMPLYEKAHAADRTLVRTFFQMHAPHVQHQIRFQIELFVAHITLYPLNIVHLHHMPGFLVVILEACLADLTNTIPRYAFMLCIDMCFLFGLGGEYLITMTTREAGLLLAMRSLVSIESKTVNKACPARCAYKVPVVNVHMLHQQLHVVICFAAQTAFDLLFVSQLEWLEIICNV